MSLLTLHKLKKQWFWLHQSSDIKKYCQTCKMCQFEGSRKPNTMTQHIIWFSPFTMVGMDFLKPITPECKATKAKYVLIIVDYFLRFVWVQTYAQANQAAVHSMWLDIIVFAFGFLQCIFNDNGTHFTGSEITTFFENYSIMQIFISTTHSLLVGLVEQNVQLVTNQIRKWVLKQKLLTKKL